jgi:hypothetical protein
MPSDPANGLQKDAAEMIGPGTGMRRAGGIFCEFLSQMPHPRNLKQLFAPCLSASSAPDGVEDTREQQTGA